MGVPILRAAGALRARRIEQDDTRGTDAILPADRVGNTDAGRHRATAADRHAGTETHGAGGVVSKMAAGDSEQWRIEHDNCGKKVSDKG